MVSKSSLNSQAAFSAHFPLEVSFYVHTIGVLCLLWVKIYQEKRPRKRSVEKKTAGKRNDLEKLYNARKTSWL